MTGVGFKAILVLASFTVLLVFNSAYATNNPDSAPIVANTYAATPVSLDLNDGGCANYGGDPNNDGICAHWKDGTYGSGLHVVFTDSSIGGVQVQYRYDLPCTPGATLQSDPSGYTVCPSTNQKDIYLQIDCMTGQCPQPQAIYDVVSAFAQQGIVLHVGMGQNPATVPTSGITDIGLHYCNVKNVVKNYDSANAACTSSSGYYQSYPFLKQNFFGTATERSGNTSYCPLNGVPPGYSPSNANAFNCLTAKRQVFHYAMFVNYQWGAPTSSGWSEVYGNDFIISLGGFTNGVGSLDEQEGSIMHELGHNLGLNHGGSDTNNYKPNYLSVMNYLYQFKENADSCRPLDYSNTALANLNENSLTDSNIGSYTYPSGSLCAGQQRAIFWSAPSGGTISSTTGVTDDWDNNGVDTNTYSQILNNMGTQGTGSGSLTTLTGFNDWNFILNGNSNNPEPMDFRPSSNFYQTVLPASNLDSDVITQNTLNHSDMPLVLADVIHQNNVNTAPSSPTGLATNVVSSSQIDLSWTSPSNNGNSPITGYEIKRSTNNGNTWSTIQANTGFTATTYSDTGLSSGTQYTYQVYAINSVGTGASSSTASGTTPNNNQQDPMQAIGWAAGLAIAAIMSGIGVWIAVRRRS